MTSPVGPLLLAAVLVSLALVACAGGTAGSPVPTGPATGMPMESGMPMDGDGEGIGALGEPAEAASADRTIHIIANDQLQFEPAEVEVRVGETVTFEIENPGTVEHEFILGSHEFQDEHEQEMQSGEMHMGDEPNEVEFDAGETVTLTWRFTEAGTTLYGCHEPGHYPAGMVGTIIVSE